jgi:hypothetical protein
MKVPGSVCSARRRALRSLASLAAAGACIVTASPAAADVSSWLSGGAGYGLKRNDSTGRDAGRVGMSFAIGVGTDPLSRVVVGGVLRSTTYFSLGTDLSLAARVASGGFARGDWGLALDVGPMWRSFGSGEYGRWPVAAMLTAGAPWGVQLAFGAELLRIAGDDAPARGFVALLEIDLLRLTVMRQGSTDRWWENPSPAGGRPEAARKPHPLAGLLF